MLNARFLFKSAVDAHLKKLFPYCISWWARWYDGRASYQLNTRLVFVDRSRHKQCLWILHEKSGVVFNVNQVEIKGVGTNMSAVLSHWKMYDNATLEREKCKLASKKGVWVAFQSRHVPPVSFASFSHTSFVASPMNRRPKSITDFGGSSLRERNRRQEVVTWCWTLWRTLCWTWWTAHCPRPFAARRQAGWSAILCRDFDTSCDRECQCVELTVLKCQNCARRILTHNVNRTIPGNHNVRNRDRLAETEHAKIITDISAPVRANRQVMNWSAA
jgi:hypothetical protein